MEFPSKVSGKSQVCGKVNSVENFDSIKTEIKNQNIANNVNKTKKYNTDRDIYDFLALVEEEFAEETEELAKFRTLIEEIAQYLNSHGIGGFNYKSINDIIPNNENSKNGGMNNVANENLNLKEQGYSKEAYPEVTKYNATSKEDKKLLKDKQDYKFLENALIKIRDILIKKPILMMELNKFLPKSYRLAVVDKDFTCKFLLKIKNKSEQIYNQVVQFLMSNKSSILNFKDLYENIEKLLQPDTELCNDFILIMEVKRFHEIKQPFLNKIKNNNSLLGKKIMKSKNKDNIGLTKKGIKLRNSFKNSNGIYNYEEKSDSIQYNMNHNSNLKPGSFINGKQNGMFNLNSSNAINSGGHYEEFVSNNTNISENFKKDCVSNNQYLKDSNYGINCKFLLFLVHELRFFSYAKDVLSKGKYNILIKSFFLYLKNIFNIEDFSNIVDHLLEDQNMASLAKNIALSRVFKRKLHNIIFKPLAEYEHKETNKALHSYYYYDCYKYQNLTCFGKTLNNLSGIFNDKYITIPNGSEDDKLLFKKNNYEENVFKYEDIRYDLDFKIETQNRLKADLKTMKDYYKFNKTDKEDKKPESKSKLLGILTKGKLKLGCTNNPDQPSSYLTHSSKLALKFIYKTEFNEMIAYLDKDPLNVITLIEERMKENDFSNKKSDLDRELKMSIDRYYSKTFDYKTFHSKIKDKKINNHKGHLNEDNFEQSMINDLKLSKIIF